MLKYEHIEFLHLVIIPVLLLLFVLAMKWRKKHSITSENTALLKQPWLPAIK